MKQKNTNKIWLLFNKTKLIYFVCVLLLAFLATYFYNNQFTSFYESRATLKLITTDEPASAAFPAMAEAILYDKDFLDKMYLDCEYSPDAINAKESIQLINHSPGTAIFSTTSINPKKLKGINSNLLTHLEILISEQLQEKYDFEKSAIEKKLLNLNNNIKEAENEIRSLKERPIQREPQTHPQQPQAQPMVPKAEKAQVELNIQQLKEKVRIAKQQLESTPKTTTTYSPKNKNQNSYLKKVAYEKEELAKLFRVYKEKHPKIIEQKKKVAFAERQLRKASGQQKITRPNPLYQQLKEGINNSQKLLTEYEIRLKNLNKAFNAETAVEPIVTEAKTEETGLEAAELAEQFKIANKLETLTGLKSEALNQLELLEIKQNTITYEFEGNMQTEKQFAVIGAAPKVSYGLSLSLALLFYIFAFVEFKKPEKAAKGGIIGKTAETKEKDELEEIALSGEGLDPEPMAEIKDDLISDVVVTEEDEERVVEKEAEKPRKTEEVLNPVMDLPKIGEPEVGEVVSPVMDLLEIGEPEADEVVSPVEAFDKADEDMAEMAKKEGEDQIEEVVEEETDEVLSPLINNKSLADSPLKFIYPTEPTDHDGRLFTLNEPDSELAKAYKKLTNNIQILTVQNRQRILMPISNKKAMGKTTLISNSAINIAQKGYQTLIIDLNTQNPSLHKIFNGSNQVGITDVIKGANLVEATQTTSIEDLHILSVGSEIEGFNNIVETELKTYIGKILQLAKRRADIIFIDSPSVEDNPTLTKVLSSFDDISIIYLQSESETAEDEAAVTNLIPNPAESIAAHIKL